MALNKNNLTKKNFSNFSDVVKIQDKSNIKLHGFGDDINDIVKALLIEGKLPIIPKIFFEESSLKSNVNNMKNNNNSNNNQNNNTSSIVNEPNNTNYQKNKINSGPNKPINRSNKSDIYGEDIINKYYTIKNSLNQLSIVKSFITSIIKTVKVELEKYRVSKRDYNIIKKLLIKKFESSLSETFKTEESFYKFKEAYVEESFNIFKEFNENMPLFQYIFNNTYVGIKDTKNYFNKLFKKYTKERNILSTHIKDNFGLLAFSPLFDIDAVTEVQKASSKTNKTNINYNDYIVYNSNNSQQNLGPEFNTNGTTTIPLNEKINEFNLMYISTYHSDYYTSQHKQKIEKIYADLKESIDGLLSGSDSMTLYDIILITLNLDFSLFELMFYYCEPLLFDTAMSSHENIKKYILDKLKTLDLYYDSYKDWLGTGIDFDKNGITDLLKFEEFFETVMVNMPGNAIQVQYPPPVSKPTITGETKYKNGKDIIIKKTYRNSPFNESFEIIE